MRHLTILALIFLLRNVMPCAGQDYCYKIIDTVYLNSEVVLHVANRHNSLLFVLYSKGVQQDEISIQDLFVPDTIVFKASSFFRNEQVYTCEFGIFGSTFGASQFVIVSQSGQFWSMTKSSFVRSSIEDMDNDGLTEIVVTYPQTKYFKFKDGIFIPYTPPPRR